MFTRHLYLDKFMRSLRGAVVYGDDDDELRRALILTVRRITDRELTSRQKEVMELCFFGGKTLTDAANILGKKKSTVSRHLSAACDRIEQALKYTGLTRL